MPILSYFRKSGPSAPFTGDDAARMKLYKKLRFQSFIAGTVGYSLYYVCRTSLNVVKKPILESGALDATQLGIIGSALLFAYAIGKFVNGFLSDHSNIKRFMAAGLCVSAVANLLVGALGFANGGGLVGNMTLFIAFAVMWGINGWSQSMVPSEQARHLLRIFQRQPQPRRVPFVSLRRGRRRHLRLAVGLRRVVGGRGVGRAGDRFPIA